MRRAWGDPDVNLRLRRVPPAEGHGRAVIELDGVAVGLILWQHPTREELEVAGLSDIPAEIRSGPVTPEVAPEVTPQVRPRMGSVSFRACRLSPRCRRADQG